MLLTELLHLVWLNLSQNKFKVFMTSIGIIVGTATIMMVIAIGTGGREEVAEQFKNLNAGSIDISYEYSGSSRGSGGFGSSGGGFGGSGGGPGSSGRTLGRSGSGGGFAPPSGGSGSFGGGFPGMGSQNRMNQERITLSKDNAEELSLMVPGIKSATISYSTSASVEGGDLEESKNLTIGGVLENYMELSNLTMAIGSFFTEEHDRQKEKVCVLGQEAAKTIFGSAYEAYNGIVYIDSRPYAVLGVFEEMGSVASGISPDGSIFIPYETGVKYLTGTGISPTITVVASDVDEVDRIKEDIKTVLSDSYPNAEFTITDAGSKMEAANASNRTLTMLLVAMAVIVFIVGGIGIMNVLFVSVKERTNEIGILKAIGCSRRDILLEFLLEASCTSLVGGLFGVLLALGITPLVESFGMRVSLSVRDGLISMAFGIITGTVFGFYPAYKASRLIPVVALNQE